jgi:NADP-dependent alcohol dehydrogenase
LAVGGGSVIDGAKFISAAVNFEEINKILQKRILIKMQSLWNRINFTCHRNEMNSGAVVTIESKEKLAFGGSAMFPKFSICDPSNRIFTKTIAKRGG